MVFSTDLRRGLGKAAPSGAVFLFRREAARTRQRHIGDSRLLRLCVDLFRRLGLPSRFCSVLLVDIRDYRLANVPRADAIAAVPLNDVEMDVAVMRRLAGPEYRGEALAGRLTQRGAQRFRLVDVRRSDDVLVREHEPLHIESQGHARAR